MRTKQLSWRVAVAVVAGAALAGAPLLDDEAKGADGAAEEESKPLLAGPEVADEPASADNPAFGGEDRMRRAVEVPVARWFRVLRDVELSDAQREQMATIAREYRQATAEFRLEHAEALRVIQERVRETRETGEFDPNLRERYREIQSKAPDAQPYQDRIWDVLDVEQQEAFRSELEVVRRRMADRRSKVRDKQLDTMRRGGVDGDAMVPGGDGAMDERDDTRGRARGVSRDAGLDAMSQRRLEFLQSRQSAAAPEGREAVRERWRERRERGARNERRPRRDREDDSEE